MRPIVIQLGGITKCRARISICEPHLSESSQGSLIDLNFAFDPDWQTVESIVHL